MSSIIFQSDGRLNVPDIVTIPCISGDGIGTEITPVMQRVVDAAVTHVYGSARRIEWLPLAAGQQAYESTERGYPKKHWRLSKPIV